LVAVSSSIQKNLLNQLGLSARLLGLVIVFMAASSPSYGGRLFLPENESISGSLVSIDEGRLRWSSPVLGELTVGLQHVEYIESERRFDVQTSAQEWGACVMSVDQSLGQMLHCDEGTEFIGSWILVTSVEEVVDEPLPILAQIGSLKLAAENSSGNSNISKYRLDGFSELRLLESRHTINLRYDEESASDTTTRNMWRTSYQYDQFFTRKWFATGNAFYEEDEFKDLDERSSVGLGLGYQFLETYDMQLNGKGTVNYLDERFSNGVERTTPAFLWNLDFVWRFNDKGMRFFHRHAFLVAFDEGDDFELATTTGFQYPINGHFSSVIQLEYDYDERPADDLIRKKDAKWSVGVDYNW
jgi:putative salt-induced outer membrane protein YdiY